MKIRKMFSIFFLLIAILCNICSSTRASLVPCNQNSINGISMNSSINNLLTTNTFVNNIADIGPNITSSISGQSNEDMKSTFKKRADSNTATHTLSFASILKTIRSFWKMGYNTASFCAAHATEFIAYASPFVVVGGIIGICQFIWNKLQLGYLRKCISRDAEQFAKTNPYSGIDPVALAKNVTTIEKTDADNIQACQLVYKLLFKTSWEKSISWKVLSIAPLNALTDLSPYLETVLSYNEILKLNNSSELNVQRQNLFRLINTAKDDTESLDLFNSMLTLIHFLQSYKEHFAGKTILNTTKEFISYARSLKELRYTLQYISSSTNQTESDMIYDLALSIPEIANESSTTISLINSVTKILKRVTNGHGSVNESLESLKQLRNTAANGRINEKRKAK